MHRRVRRRRRRNEARSGRRRLLLGEGFAVSLGWAGRCQSGLRGLRQWIRLRRCHWRKPRLTRHSSVQGASRTGSSAFGLPVRSHENPSPQPAGPQRPLDALPVFSFVRLVLSDITRSEDDPFFFLSVRTVALDPTRTEGRRVFQVRGLEVDLVVDDETRRRVLALEPLGVRFDAVDGYTL
jgi:hypothetical protein